jgi:hypothetical protein
LKLRWDSSDDDPLFGVRACVRQPNDRPRYRTRHAAKLMGHEDIRETLNTYSHLWDRVRTDETVRQAMAL